MGERKTRVAWLTDPHLDRVTSRHAEALCRTINEGDPSAVLISGDIAIASTVRDWLTFLHQRVLRPIHFVLGNHDYWGDSISNVRSTIKDFIQGNPQLNWLDNDGVVALSDDIGLVGYGGWNDAWGNGRELVRLLKDYRLIHDFVGLSNAELKDRLGSLGDEAAGHFRRFLPKALDRFPLVVAVTHYPPFKEALPAYFVEEHFPHMMCYATGEVMSEIMVQRTDKALLVLSGHTHVKQEVAILPNLTVNGRWSRIRTSKRN